MTMSVKIDVYRSRAGEGHLPALLYRHASSSTVHRGYIQHCVVVGVGDMEACNLGALEGDFDISWVSDIEIC